jgi:hypothetical protein
MKGKFINGDILALLSTLNVDMMPGAVTHILQAYCHESTRQDVRKEMTGPGPSGT